MGANAVFKPHRDWFTRNWKWLVPSVLVLGGACFVGGLLLAVQALMRNSEPYQHGLARANASSTAVANLGSPLKPGWMPSGEIKVTGGGGGYVDLAIPLSGSKGKGTLYVIGKRRLSKWEYDVLELYVEREPPLKIDLLKEKVDPTQAQTF